MKLFLFPLLIFCTVCAAGDLDNWLDQEFAIAIQKMEANISPVGSAPGAVIASPQTQNPDYYFHWTRDASVTMNTVVTLFQNASGAERINYHDQLIRFTQFSRSTQLAAGDMGEPKFYVDGRPFTASWCRPQSDGPASRIIALTRFATVLLNQSEEQVVRTLLYESSLPTNSVIKNDLEYVSHHWADPTCDLWEEVSGDHFYTRMVQRRALLDGAVLADRLGDPLAAKWYRLQATAVEQSLARFWNGGVFVPTINQTGGMSSKTSGIDSSTIVAALHGNRADGFMPMLDSRLQSTFHKNVNAFQGKYSINNRVGMPGLAIGRYPEDVYDGLNFQGGNPWVLLTAAFANFCYRSANELLDQGKKSAAQDYIDQGDSFLARIRFHANPDGSLSEQIQRDTGFMTSARDLTWGYVEFIEAVSARRKTLAARPFDSLPCACGK